MKTVYNLSIVILRLYFRDPLTLFLSIGLLVMMMIMFGVMGTGDIANLHLPVAVLDLSQGRSDALAKISADSILTVKPAQSRSDLTESIRSAQAILGVVIHEPSRDQTGATHPQIEIIASEESKNHWVTFATEHLDNLLLAERNQAGQLPVAHLPIHVVGNRFIDYIFPGVMSLSVLEASLACVMLLLSAKKLGVLRRLQITPLNSAQLLGGFLLGRCIIILIHLAVLVLVATVLFQARIQTSFGVLALVIGLGILCFMSLAAVIAQLAPSYEAGAIITQFMTFPMAFLSGVFFKNENMPPVMQHFANLLPLTHFVNLMRGTIQAGLPLSNFMPQITILSGWSLACFALFLFLNSRRQFNAE